MTKKRGRKPGQLNKRPLYPARVEAVRRMVDEDQLPFAEVGRRLNMSRAGARQLYKRWGATETRCE